jgi:Sucrase/ferredoxin-like
MTVPAVPQVPRAGVRGIADRCAPSAQRRGDPLYGSASPVSRWLLVEQPGAWGRDALRQSTLDRRVATVLAARGVVAGVRVVLVRRVGRPVDAVARRWAQVDSRPGREGTWWGDYADARELLDLPLRELPPGPPSANPVYLVCTHGAHDACCAIRGRPVAAAMAAERPEATWECSHIGGDRFAANVVVLPHGLYYGHVPPGAVGELARAYERRRVLPHLLRGRSSFPQAVQAAQHHARRVLHEDRLDALAPVRVDQLAESRWRVTLDAAGLPVTVTVAAHHAVPARLTCSAAEPQAARVFSLVALDLPGATARETP